MSRVTYHKNKTLTRGFKIHVTAGVTAALACLAVFALCFVAARGPYRSFAKRLCATMTEKNSLFTGVFFTSDEIAASKLYYPPEESFENENGTREYKTCAGGTALEGDGWQGFIIEVSSSSLMLAENQAGVQSGRISLGLDGYVDAVFFNNCLSYAGEGGLEKYCFVGQTQDGKLHIGATTVVDAANAAYLWGISADRVLVNGGVPCSSLGGGYASRAAIGQREDGTVLIFTAGSAGFYPCGITYDEMASIMYSYGAQNAAALKLKGGLYVNASLRAGSKDMPGYSLTAAGTEAAK